MRTWVDDALLPLGIGYDLVLVHHLDVLVLHVAAAEGRRHGQTYPVLGRAGGGCGRLAHLMALCFSWWWVSTSWVKRMVW